tara:strand:+ start:1257 stop:1649 length:393 start_codon:yes stop_codon:yes gene_type:complete
MALQSSGQISLNDIRAELGAATTNVSLGAMSDTAGFAAQDAISDFYGYSAGGTSFLAGSKQTSSGFACFQSQNVTYYHNGSGSDPVTNDYIYSDEAMTTIVTSGYYRKDTIAFEWFRTNGFGRIFSSGQC